MKVGGVKWKTNCRLEVQVKFNYVLMLIHVFKCLKINNHVECLHPDD